MGNGRKREEDIRDQRVTIQVTKKEKEMVKELAAEAGMELSDYIRVNCIYKPFKNFFGGN